MKRTLLSICAALTIFGAVAQQNGGTLTKGGNSEPKERCNTEQKMQELRDQDPLAYEQRKIESELEIQDWINNYYDSWQAQRAVITIPVVVQIWANTSSVPDAAVYEQIQTLNEDFRRTNSDASNTPSVFSSVAADCEIEFCLASFDELGNATTGIIRQTAGGQPNGNNELWDTDKYLNIYVYSIGGGTLGYTYLPSQAPNNAVHIGADYFGTTGAQSPFNLGRTATHEVGHWLNLEHIWGDSNCGNDQVSDTPPAQTANYNCPSHPHNLGTCSGNTDGEMFMNYMDYVNDNCMNTFTAGQKARMISAINNYRSGLLTSAQTACTGTNSPDAEFQANVTTINVGQSVNFTDLSTGIFGTWGYNWTFTGGTPSSSTATNPSGIQYSAAGTYTVALTIDSSGVSDTETKTGYITVVDPSAASCDTLAYPFSGTPTIYGDGAGGYVSGNNQYGDLAKADLFSNPSPYNYVTGAMIYFGAATGTGNVDIEVWNSSGTSIGSESVSISAIASNMNSGNPTKVWFDPAIQVSGDFYLGVTLPTASGDTVAVITNSSGESATNTAYEMWSDGSWYAYDDANGWQISLTHAIHPIVCSAVNDIEEVVTINGMSIYPNPSTGELTLYFGEQILTNGVITVTDLTGKVTLQKKCNSNLENIDLSNAQNGIYLISVNAENFVSTRKVQILK